MEDDLEDECIAAELVYKGETHYLEYFKDFNRRVTFRIAHIAVGVLWCEENLPHMVVVPASSIGATYCVPDLVCDWVGENTRGMWSIGTWSNNTIPHELFIFYFELPRDAMLFKLRWS